ncbi:AAA family ATPase [Candidatus Micrarchaeota archaeon]|nr:AAA family ATPase [Candidatus Micrarchaeota archaeon]
MIVGLVGQNCAGKDTAAAYFVSKGFQRYSLSDYLREELEKQGKPVTRETLVNLGNELRETKGAGHLAEKALERFKPGANYVVVSIRNPGEAQALMQKKNFALVALEAPAQVRYERMRARDRGEKDPQTFEEFLRLENQENRGGAQQSIAETMRLADYTIDASGSIEEETKEVERLCLKLNIK